MAFVLFWKFNFWSFKMKFDDLSRDMVCELKQAYLVQREFGDESKGLSWNEITNADSLVSDSEIRAFVGDCEFSEDDFCCNTMEAI